MLRDRTLAFPYSHLDARIGDIPFLFDHTLLMYFLFCHPSSFNICRVFLGIPLIHSSIHPALTFSLFVYDLMN